MVHLLDNGILAAGNPPARYAAAQDNGLARFTVTVGRKPFLALVGSPRGRRSAFDHVPGCAPVLGSAH
jgi:hypothetical protein